MSGALSGFASGLSTSLDAAQRRKKRKDEPERTDLTNKNFKFVKGGKVPRKAKPAK